MVRMYFLLAASLCLLCTASGVSAQDGTPQSKLKSDELGSTRNVHSCGDNLLCGQPSPKDFQAAKNRGIEVVISLREKGEIPWDEHAEVTGLGLTFHHLGFRTPESLTDDILDRALKVLAAAKQSPVLLHCASANRVGAVWLAHRVLNDGISIEAAGKEAKAVGLRTPGYEERVVEYIKRRAAD